MTVFHGRVLWARAHSATTLIKTKTAILRVWWAGGVLPPVVFVGRNINGLGKIKTFNDGKIIQISDAIPFKANYWQVMEPVYMHLWRYLEDPREWCDPWLVDKQKIGEYEAPKEIPEP